MDAQEPWTRGRSRTLGTLTIYRAKYAITDPNTVDVPSGTGDRGQALDLQLLRRAQLDLTLADPPADVMSRARDPLQW